MSFNAPIGNYKYIGTAIRPSLWSVSTTPNGFVTSPTNAFDVNTATYARISSSVTQFGSATCVYGGFPASTTKSATFTITSSSSGISGAVVASVVLKNGATTLTTWTDAAFTSTVTYSLPDGINTANISVSITAGSSTVGHTGSGSQSDIYDITISQ